MTAVRIPSRFYYDHMERDLDTPAAVKQTRTHVWIDTDDPALPELISDARYYAHREMVGELWLDYRGLVLSARATLKALAAALSVSA